MDKQKNREQSYPSDLTAVQWAGIEPLFAGLREYTWTKRELTDAVLYFVKTGCQWRHLPHDFPPYATVYSFFRRTLKVVYGAGFCSIWWSRRARMQGAGYRGTFILDVDEILMSLLGEAREKLEAMIDASHAAGYTQGKKPRTYRKCARRDYLRFARNRKPSHKLLRKSLRRQLGYVARNLLHLDQILKDQPDALSSRQMEVLSVIRTLYEQQREMYEERTHTVKDRIVSISQPHIRPIVRGKARAETEFGAKVEVSLVNGYARIEKLGWDAFNEGGTL